MMGAHTSRRVGPHVLVMAKAPVAGRVKTRLCPPCTPEQAAELAQAALSDTLEAVAACAAGRRIVALEGQPGPWLPVGFEVIPQRGDTFDERLTRAWTAAGGPGLQIGMDTPQVTTAILDDALEAIEGLPPRAALLGPATDGGWWAIGLGAGAPISKLFKGVPMSTDHTGRDQEERLRSLGYHVSHLPALVDLDQAADLAAIAKAAPNSRTTKMARRLGLVGSEEAA